MTQCPSTFRFPCIKTTSGLAGLSAQELADILSPLINGGGGGSSNSLFLTKSVNQLIGATPDTVTWDESSGEIGFAANQIQLLAGNKYHIICALRGSFTGAGSAQIAIHDATNAEDVLGITTAGHGQEGLMRPMSAADNVSSSDSASAIMTPSTNIDVEVRIVAETNLQDVLSFASWASVTQLG